MYHTLRWDNETAYFDIKNHLEAERFNSGKYNIVVCELYGKILCYSICGALYKEGDDQLIADRPAEGMTTAYDYIPDMKYIVDSVRTVGKVDVLYSYSKVQSWRAKESSDRKVLQNDRLHDISVKKQGRVQK